MAALDGPVRPRLKVRRREDAGCVRHHRPFRPEAEGVIALPRHESGLGVIASAGPSASASTAACRNPSALRERGVAACGRTVANLPDRGACPPAG